MKLPSIFAAAVLLLVAQPTGAHADIRFGIAAEPFPPFLFKDASGQWVGWEADVMAALCKQIGETCIMRETAWDGLIPALEAKQFDVIWASMAITDKRREAIGFTHWYYNTRVFLIGAKTGDRDILPGHFSGKAIGVQVGTIHERYVQKYFAPAAAVVKTYATQDEAQQDLAAGRIDYVQGAAAGLDGFLKSDEGKACCELKGAVPMDAAILGEGVGGGLRKDDAALKAKLDAGLAAMAKAGAFDAITAKYPGLGDFIFTPKE